MLKANSDKQHRMSSRNYSLPKSVLIQPKKTAHITLALNMDDVRAYPHVTMRRLNNGTGGDVRCYFVLRGSLLIEYESEIEADANAHPLNVYCIEDAVVDAHGTPAVGFREWAVVNHALLIRVERWDYDLYLIPSTEGDLMLWYEQLLYARIGEMARAKHDQIGDSDQLYTSTFRPPNSDPATNNSKYTLSGGIKCLSLTSDLATIQLSEESIAQLEHELEEEKAKLEKLNSQLSNMLMWAAEKNVVLNSGHQKTSSFDVTGHAPISGSAPAFTSRLAATLDSADL